MPSPQMRAAAPRQPTARTSLEFHRALTPVERAEQAAADERRYERRRRRRLGTTILGCVGSCAVGLYLIGLGMHLTDPGVARMAFLGGLTVGNGGLLATLLVGYLGAVEDGEL